MNEQQLAEMIQENKNKRFAGFFREYDELLQRLGDKWGVGITAEPVINNGRIEAHIIPVDLGYKEVSDGRSQTLGTDDN